MHWFTRFDKTRNIFDKDLISNMDVLQDNLCFILDVEGFSPMESFFMYENWVIILGTKNTDAMLSSFPSHARL